MVRLNKYANSPAYPLLYYPLPDAHFEKVMVTIRGDLEDRIDHLLREPTAPSKQTARYRMPKASEEIHRQARHENLGRILAALTLGNIVRHYGMIERKLDFSDSTMFLFWRVNGVGLTYQMHEGLSLKLGTEAEI